MLCIYLATIEPFNDADKRDKIDVDIRVLFLRGSMTKDKTLCNDYDKMFEEKGKYEFLCYCALAKIVDKKRVAFLAYKLVNNHQIIENEEQEIDSLKRKRNSPEAALQNKR